MFPARRLNDSENDILWNQQWILAFTFEARKKGKKTHSPKSSPGLVILELMTLDSRQPVLWLRAGALCRTWEAMEETTCTGHKILGPTRHCSPKRLSP
jgi:hypothetical protein